MNTFPVETRWLGSQNTFLQWNLNLFCQDFKANNVGQETKWCPSISCNKCKQNAHTKLVCMIGMENKPLPNDVIQEML